MRRAFLPIVLSVLALAGNGCLPPPKSSIADVIPALLPSSVNDANVRLLSVDGLPGFSASTTLRLIRAHERLTGELFDPAQSRSLAIYGEASSTQYDLYIGDQMRDLGHVYATETNDGTFASMFVDTTGKASALRLQALEARPAFQVVAYQKSEPLSTKSSCDFQIAYPQLTADSGIPSDIRDRINTEIVSSTKPLPFDDNRPPATLEEGAQRFIQVCKETNTDLLNQFATDTPPYQELPWYYDQTFDIPRFDSKILSIIIAQEDYTGGAHGSHSYWFLNFDLHDGRLLTIGDLISRDRLKTFFQREKRHILTNADGMLFDDNIQQFKDFVNSKTVATADELQAFSQFNSFYLTPASLVTFYNEYEIAPYAAGPQSIELPYESFSDLLSNDSVLR